MLRYHVYKILAGTKDGSLVAGFKNPFDAKSFIEVVKDHNEGDDWKIVDTANNETILYEGWMPHGYETIN